MPSFDIVSETDILRQKAVEGGVDLASLESADPICGLKAARREIRIRQGIDTETAKRIIKIINLRD